MSNEALHTGLRKIIPDYAPAGEDTLAAYAVDEVIPQAVVSPENIEALAAVVRLAATENYGIIPRGGGTKTDIGLPPTRADIIVLLDKMNQVLEHEPADQTITVQAGMRLSDLQGCLKDHGQYWPLDPPHAEACTLGGILATDACGPLRMTFGTARDLVIGLRIVKADGTIIISGGKVVKNVAGYDMNKLFVGSLGTLGILAEVTLKLQPLPETGRLVVGRFSSLSAVTDTAFALLASDVMPAFVEMTTPGFPLIAGIIGQKETVDWQTAACEKLFQDAGAVEVIHMDGDQYQATLDTLRSFPAGQTVPQGMQPGATCRASVTPEHIGDLYQLAEDRCRDTAIGFGMLTHFSSGHMSLVFYQEAPFDEPAFDILAGIIGELQQAATDMGGSLIITHAPTALKCRAAVWGTARDDLAVMRLLKKQFDPESILNSGRFIGGI